MAVVRDDDLSAALLESLAPVFAADFECTMRFPGIKPVIYRGGLEALRAAWLDRLKYWDEYRYEVEGVVDTGDHIVVFHRAHARRTAIGAGSVVHVAGIWAVRDSLICSGEFNVPHAEARAIAYRVAENTPEGDCAA